MSSWGLDCPVSWDCPWWCSCSPALQPLGWALHFYPTLLQKPAGWGWMQDPEMRWSRTSSWTRCTWPIRESLHPQSPDSGHISVSELSPCKGSADVETATGVKSNSPETVVRKADDMMGKWTRWVLRWFREVGPVKPSVTSDHKCISKFSSVAQSCLTLRDPMNRSMPGLPVPHQLPEFTQTHVHRVSDAIQPSHPLSSPSPPAPNTSQHQSISNDSTLQMRWPKYSSFSFSIIPSKEIPELISFPW